jgi:RNA polymerase sigma-70 factor (ECF subfamily)
MKDSLKKMRMDEQELVRQIQDGDEMAFAEIVKIYKDKIVNFLCKLTGDYQKAVDLSQETFMRVYFKADKYRPVAPFSSWIYAIASNLAKTEMKKMRKYAVISLDEVQNHLPPEVYRKNPPDSGLVQNLRKALDALHPRYRIPVILKDIEGFSQEEIAQILKRPLGTIKARINRGRNHLKKELEKASYAENSFAKKEEYQDGCA